MRMTRGALSDKTTIDSASGELEEAERYRDGTTVVVRRNAERSGREDRGPLGRGKTCWQTCDLAKNGPTFKRFHVESDDDDQVLSKYDTVVIL